MAGTEPFFLLWETPAKLQQFGQRPKDKLTRSHAHTNMDKDRVKGRDNHDFPEKKESSVQPMSWRPSPSHEQGRRA